MMKTGKSRVIAVIILLLLAAAVILCAYLYDVKKYQKTVQSMTISEVDLGTVPDGAYEGECNVDYIYAKVLVTVEKGEISGIELMEHKNERGSSAEKIVNNIVEKQKIDVDAISGATNSSKVIKKAVENALESAIQ